MEVKDLERIQGSEVLVKKCSFFHILRSQVSSTTPGAERLV